jgi:hypothetical protein
MDPVATGFESTIKMGGGKQSNLKNVLKSLLKN